MNLIGEEVKLKSLFVKRVENGRENSWYNINFNTFDVEYLDKKAICKIDKASKEYDILLNADYGNKY
ncbi:hypothetical protein KDE13_01890 [Campylobacter sp. faydin G-140]|uniref:hypothetical protein n=1 Tax=Campylobacter anatolicus TaxID=2829105 RepID=UPI001B92987A|nr:hypothetical protein [Campylobacter anatolicus]MBR8465115.1 hypothetical protein [Campylobacter anatolicus]